MHVVIVGGGLAAASAAAELRDQGHSGDITVLTAEPHLPYERPPLSKDLLLGTIEPAAAATTVAVHDAARYKQLQVDLRTGDRVSAIDLDRQRVTTGRGALAYDRLLLATGSTARPLPLVDDAARRHGLPVHYLRTLDDALRLRAAFDSGPHGHLLVVGAGWIGLEVASAARAAGLAVTVVDGAPQPLHAVLGDRLGAVFADLHREHGVDLRLGTGLRSVDRDPQGRVTVMLTDGRSVTPDLVVVGIGAVPADELAATAGLATDDGVWVNARLRASDPAVFAAGDIAAHDHPVLGYRVRVEHWDNAAQQGRAAARVMLGGDDAYERLPYFFTDQYDLGMEYVGHVPRGASVEVVVRGDEAGRVLTAFWVSGTHVLAGMHLNDWDATDDIRRLVSRDVPLDSLRDPAVPLDAIQPRPDRPRVV